MTSTDPTAARRAERLFATHHAPLLRYVRRRDPSIADDVVSEVFAIAWRRIEDVPGEAEFAWLRATADHVMRNHWRARRRSAALVDAIAPTVSDAVDPAEPPVVGAALGAMDDRGRALLTMTGFEGLSAPEAAERLGISAGTARNVLVRARRDFAVHLAAAGIVVACALLAILFVRSAPDRQIVARTARAIEHARTVRQSLAVRTPGAVAATAAVVQDDRLRQRRSVSLPGGVTASAVAGERLRIDARDGIPRDERVRAQQRFATELAALDATAPDRLAVLLTSPAARAARSVRFAGQSARVVTGPVQVGSRRFAVEVLVDAREPALLRARVRPSGATAEWTTIEVRDWRLVGTLPSAPPAGAATSSAPAPSARHSETTARGSTESAARSQPVPVARRSLRTRTSDARLQAASNAAWHEPYRPYGGSTGAILHFRTALAPLGPSGGAPLGRHEMWVELGHGRRVRQVHTLVSDGVRRRTDALWSPSGVIEVRGPSRPVLTRRCDDDDLDASTWARRTIAALDDARRHLDALPAGPVLAGEPTRVVRGITWSSSDFPATLLVAEASGQVVGIDEGSGPQRLLGWEVIPAGGPADPLEPRIPADIVAAGPRDC